MMSVFLHFCAVHLGSHGLEYHFETVGDAEPRAHRTNIQLVRTKVMEDRGAAVEQRLNINELARPISLFEHTLTESEKTRARLLRAP